MGASDKSPKEGNVHVTKVTIVPAIAVDASGKPVEPAAYQNPAMTTHEALLEEPPPEPSAPQPPAAPSAIPPTGEYPLILKLTDIYVDPKFNIRHEYEPSAMTRLAGSLTERGQFQSILVQPKAGCTWWPGGPNGESFLLIQGFRRFFSAKEAKKENFICIVKSFATREDALAANAEENIQHEQITLYDTLMRVKQLIANSKLLHDPIRVADDTAIHKVAEQLSSRLGANLETCEQMITILERVAPEIVDKLRYDETVEQIARVELCANVGGVTINREEKFRRQLVWWKNEGWKTPRGSGKPAGALTARQEFVFETAQRIKSSRLMKDADGQTIELSSDMAAAICNALEWAVAPKTIKRKAPL